MKKNDFKKRINIPDVQLERSERMDLTANLPVLCDSTQTGGGICLLGELLRRIELLEDLSGLGIFSSACRQTGGSGLVKRRRY